MKLDFKINLPKGYISFSAMNTYLYDPKAYFDSYMMKIDFMVDLKKNNIGRWEKIRMGKHFQEALSDPRINWRKKVKADGFTPDKIRIIETALNQHNLIKMPISQCEVRLWAELHGIKLTSVFDGFKLKDKFLLETKFGAVWTQEKADEDNQLSWYCMMIKKEFGFIPKKIILQSVSDTSGKVKIIETKRDKDDLKHIEELIINTVRSISLGQFNQNDK